jgi:hypothetical protein
MFFADIGSRSVRSFHSVPWNLDHSLCFTTLEKSPAIGGIAAQLD